MIAVGSKVKVDPGWFGLPYSAIVEKLAGEKATVRPLHAVLTEGSARHYKSRGGPSIRARSVRISALSEIE